MTENEIKEYIEELRHKTNTLIKSGYATSGISTHFNKSADLIEELLQYKLNGSFSGVELAQLAAMQMRLRDYQEIGTIEEFKALKEKNEPKKAEVNEFDYGEGYVCGECESFLHYVDDDDEHIRTNYCCHCGTRIDWSE